MNLYTSALVEAIDRGVTDSGARPEKDPLKATYQYLKALLAGRLRDGAALLETIGELERDAGSVSRQLTLSAQLAAARADANAEVHAAFQMLQRHLALHEQAVRLGGTRLNLPPAGREASANYAVQQVFFATDRDYTESALPAAMFGARRAEIQYGTCEISIPRDHRMGELEQRAFWRFEFRPDPAKHVVLLAATLESKEDFFAAMSRRLDLAPGQHAFVFFHGYNVSFEDAARRTGQMAYDLGFDGAAVFYSWPSQASLHGYMVDEGNVEWAQANITTFLHHLLSNPALHHVYLIAHSMGNRALTRALASLLAEQPALAAKVREIILAAPDIDAEVFKRDIAPALTASGRPLTLYASSDDLALAASKQIHGYARAGESGDALVVLNGMETIDASGVDTGFVKHAYFAENRSALSDMFYLITSGARADQRFGLTPVDTAAGRHWAFRK